MSGQRRVAVLLLFVLVGGCGAVEVPAPRAYRLPEVEAVAAPRACAQVLRVQDLRLAAHLSPEYVMVGDGPNLLQAHALEQWAGPLDRMLTDTVVAALRRSAAFADVKCGSDVGGEDLWLTATVTDFHYVRAAAGAQARVGLDVQLRRSSDHALLLAREVKATAPVPVPNAPVAVQALGVAVRAALAQLVEACTALPAAPEPERAPPGLAEPPGSR